MLMPLFLGLPSLGRAQEGKGACRQFASEPDLPIRWIFFHVGCHSQDDHAQN
jgi:hypothetical protein